MTKTKKRKIKTWIKDNKDVFEMFTWFWGANTLLASFLIIVYKSMLHGCVIV